MMQVVKIQPQKRPFKGVFSIPGDKSITHRAIILSAIMPYSVCIQNWLPSLDCRATMQAMIDMGVTILADGDDLWIEGVGLYGLKAPSKPIDCGNSGTTMRLLMGLLAAQPFDSVLLGDASLSKRPMARVASLLNAMGANIHLSEQGTAPVTILGGCQLDGYQAQLAVNSSQVKSALQLAGLYAAAPIDVSTQYPCRDHTERMLDYLSHTQNNLTPGHSVTMNVPGDFSSASFFIVAATIVPGSHVRLSQVSLNSTRLGLLHILKQMGANISLCALSFQSYEWRGDIVIRASKLKAIKVPENMVPLMIDEFPIFAVAACIAEGQTTFRGASELRKKESDRLEAIACNLSRLGVHVQVYEDGLSIQGNHRTCLKGGDVHSYGDHRIAMAMFMLALLARENIVIQDTACIATSFPNFFQLASQFGFSFEISDASIGVKHNEKLKTPQII